MGKIQFNWLTNQSVSKHIRVILITFCILFHSSIHSTEIFRKKINLLQNSLIGLSNKENLEENKQSLNLSNIVEEIYDYKKMIKMIIGKTNWNALEKKEQTELALTFKDFIVFNYIKRFKNSENLIFEFIGTKEVAKNYKIVMTHLLIKDEKIKINYLFHKSDTNWKIFDVLLEGAISEISTKKTEYSKFIRENGANMLSKSLKEKMLLK